MLSLKNPLHAVRFTIVAAFALGCAQIASAALVDIRVAWDADGAGSPNQIPGHNKLVDGYNEILGAFGNGGIQVAGDNAANLIDFPTKANTGVGVTWAGWKGTNYGNNAFSATTNWVLRDITGAMLYRNYPTADATPGTVTFTGLTAGNSYQVEVVMAGFVGGGDWNVTIGGVNANTTFDANDTALTRASWNAPGNGTADTDWLIWSAATATLGTITINFADATGAPVDGLAAIRITGDIAAAEAVPEPSTFVLAALGLVGLGLVAWRRRK